MVRARHVSNVIREVFKIRKQLVLSKLRLSSKEGRLPNQPAIWRFERKFRQAAKADLRRVAKVHFRRHVDPKPVRFLFKRRATAQEFDLRTRKKFKKPRPLIYVYWGYKSGRRNRSCVYVGRTEKHLGRPADHRKVLRNYRITQTLLYRTSSRHLSAAECLAIHAYDPEENRMKASNAKYKTKCRICTQIRKAWREFVPLVRANAR